jgi:hypothetical protein
MLLFGSLFMSTTANSTATAPHEMIQHQATVYLSGLGWKRLVESLNDSDTNTIFDPVFVQCLLQFFVLGSSCREFHAFFRNSSVIRC